MSTHVICSKQQNLLFLFVCVCFYENLKTVMSKPQRAKLLQANEGNRGNKMPSGALIWVGLEWRVMTLLRYFIIFTNKDFIPPQSPAKMAQWLTSIIVPNSGFLVALWPSGFRPVGCINSPPSLRRYCWWWSWRPGWQRDLGLPPPL